MKSIWNFFIDTVETIVIAAAIFVVVYLFLVQPHQIKGVSMDTTFRDGQYILTDKISYRFSKPARGDVVVFQAPKEHELDYIKRIIALPGEKIKIADGNVIIYNQQHPDGIRITENYLADNYTAAGVFAKDGDLIELGPDEYFVLGDNRPRSSDSRVWGPVTKKEIVGRVWLRYWPLNQVSIIPGIKYGF